MGKSDLGARISQRTIFQIYINSNYTFFAILYLREGVYSKKTFLNGHCPDRSYMMMILVIVVMLMMMTMTKNQTTTMTLWSKYTPFKYFDTLTHIKTFQ